MPEPSRFPPDVTDERRPLPPPMSPRQLAATRVEREAELDLANLGVLAYNRGRLRRVLDLHPETGPSRRLSDAAARAHAWTAMAAMRPGQYVSDATKVALDGVVHTDADFHVVHAFATVANVAVRVSGSAAEPEAEEATR